MTADAKTVADGILANASAQASDIVARAQADVAEIKLASDALVQEAKDAEQAVLANRDLIAAEVADLEARATAAREYLAKLAG